MTDSISPTRAAILGQLTWGPHTAYELTLAMSQHVRFVWPRAHSHVYREVKALARDGLAGLERGATGRRPRTVYSLSDAGRAALRRWLASEPGGVALEHEPLLRVMFASSGTRADLLAAVEHARVLAEEVVALGRSHGERYLAGGHERQSEVHIRAFTFDYLIRWGAFSAQWADRVRREVDGWDDLRATERRSGCALDGIARTMDELVPDAGGAGPARDSTRTEVGAVVRAYRDWIVRGEPGALAGVCSDGMTLVGLDGSVHRGPEGLGPEPACGVHGSAPMVDVDLHIEDVTELGRHHAVARVRQSVRPEGECDDSATAAIVTMVLERGSGPWRIRLLHCTPVVDDR